MCGPMQGKDAAKVMRAASRESIPLLIVQICSDSCREKWKKRRKDRSISVYISTRLYALRVSNAIRQV